MFQGSKFVQEQISNVGSPWVLLIESDLELSGIYVSVALNTLEIKAGSQAF